jgi:hypothetical protein
MNYASKNSKHFVGEEKLQYNPFLFVALEKNYN